MKIKKITSKVGYSFPRHSQTFGFEGSPLSAVPGRGIDSTESFYSLCDSPSALLSETEKFPPGES